jgi:hypothetical protein
MLGKIGPQQKAYYEPSVLVSITKTSNERIGSPKMQRAQKQRPPTKKEATPKHNGLENKVLR